MTPNCKSIISEGRFTIFAALSKWLHIAICFCRFLQNLAKTPIIYERFAVLSKSQQTLMQELPVVNESFLNDVYEVSQLSRNCSILQYIFAGFCKIYKAAITNDRFTVGSAYINFFVLNLRGWTNIQSFKIAMPWTL